MMKGEKSQTQLSWKEVLLTCVQVLVMYLESFWKMIWPPERRSIRGERVLVTGAAHGIGRQMALEFARLGAELVLWDIKLDELILTAREIRSIGAEVNFYVCDVSRADDIKSVAWRVRQEVGHVDILVNNAGVLNGGAILDMLDEDIQRTFNVNTLAQFWTVREFLPDMIEKGYGHILNVASASANSGTAYLVDYSSSKAAVLVFSEGLAEELLLLGHTGVGVTVVCPAFVNTGLCKHPKDRFNRLLTPRETALAAIDGMLRGEFKVSVPRSLWLGLKFSSLLPERAHMKLKRTLNMGIDPQYRAAKPSYMVKTGHSKLADHLHNLSDRCIGDASPLHQIS